MKKNIITAIFAGLSAFALFTAGAYAASAEGITVTDGGNVTVQSKEQGVCAFQFSLDVTADEGTEVSFEFDGGLAVRVAEYRYNEDTGIMNIYVADSKPLFDASESLTVGAVKGGTASAVEDSFKLVDGALGIRSGESGETDNPDNPDTPDTPNNPSNPDSPDNSVSSEGQTSEPENTEGSDTPVSTDSGASETEKTEVPDGPASSDSDISNSEISESTADNGGEQTSEAIADISGNGSDNDDPNLGTGSFNEAVPVLITVLFVSVLAAAVTVAAKRSRKK